MKRKSIALILAIITLLTMQPEVVFAQTNTDITQALPDTVEASESTQQTETIAPPVENTTDTQEYLSNYLAVDYTPPSYNPRSLMRMASGSFDASYTTADLPTVRDQTPYGTCWAHSMMLALEISMIKQNIASSSDINLSELQLAWFHHKGALKNSTYNDPLDNFSGDHNIYTNTMFGGVLGGDNVLFAVKTLASWMGPVQEDERTAYYNAASIARSGLDYSYAFDKDAAHLSDVRSMNLGNSDQIKQAIIDYGAVIIEYKHDDSYYKNNIYYYANPTVTSKIEADHSVTIIGWDDTISKSNFSGAPGDGAWLVRNSWGAGPGIGKNEEGNFYISYYSNYVTSSYPAWTFKVAPLSDSDYCYQYDGTCSRQTISVDPINETNQPKAANIFEAKHGENIEAVSFWLDNMTGVPFTVSVYTGVEPDKPVSGTLMAEVTGTTDFAGYYTIPLNEPVPVAAGELFSAVVTFTNNTERDFSLPIDADDAYGDINEIHLQMQSVSLPRQSFVYVDKDKGWQDASQLDPETDTAAGPGNCRVKVFTKKAPVEEIAITADTELMYAGNEYQLFTVVTPTNATVRDVDMSISSGTDVASINDDGILTTIKAGQVTVRAAAKDGSDVYSERIFTISGGTRTLSSIKITRLPNKITYFRGDAFNDDGLVVSAVYDDNTKVDVTNEATLTGFSSSTPATSVVTAEYSGYTASFTTYTFGGVALSLSLEGTIAIIFITEFPEYEAAGYTPGMLAFSYNPTPEQIKAAYDAKRGLVSFTTIGTETTFKYSNIAAKQMNDDVYIVLFAVSQDADGDEHVTFGAPSSRSAVDFASLAYGQFSDNLLIMTMLTDMLNYGAKAQEFFEYRTDALANSELTDAQKAYASTQPLEFSRIGARFKDALSSGKSKIDVTDFSLTLESEISLNFYAKIEGSVKSAELLIFRSAPPDENAFYSRTMAYQKVPMESRTIGSDVKYMAGIPNIFAKKMRTPYYARVCADLNNGTRLYSDIIRYDVESHVKTIKNAPQYKDQWPLTEAMMRYGDSAKAYFDSIN